jgi:surface protein
MSSTVELFYFIGKIHSYEPGITDIIIYYLKSYTFKSTKELQTAVQLFKTNKIECEKKYNKIRYWDTSYISNMSRLFEDFKEFNENISEWDVSNVNNMSCMFGYASNFNKSLNDWDVSNVINMDYMFFEANSFKQSLNNWKLLHVKNKKDMFFGTQSI